MRLFDSLGWAGILLVMVKMKHRMEIEGRSTSRQLMGCESKKIISLNEQLTYMSEVLHLSMLDESLGFISKKWWLLMVSQIAYKSGRHNESAHLLTSTRNLIIIAETGQREAEVLRSLREIVSIEFHGLDMFQTSSRV